MKPLGEEVTRLIKDLQKGRGDFGKLFDLTYHHLRLVALNYLYSPADVEDVLSEVYFKVYTYLNSADVSRNCYYWMCGITKNVAFDYNSSHEAVNFVDNVSANNLFSLSLAIAADGENGDLLKAVSLLKPEDRKIVYYRFWEDKTYAEIAEMFHTRKSNIFKRLKTILRQLSQNLGK